MAAKLALMKLKQTASGDSGVPMESRVYLDVMLPGSAYSSASSVPQKHSSYWFDQVYVLYDVKCLV